MSSYSKNDSICSPVEKIVFIDSCNVSVPISYIRLTNEKLIERKYLIAINNEKDSVINGYSLYCVEQRNIIENIKRDVQKAKDIKLHQEMNRATSMAYATLTGATVKIVSNHDNHLNSSVSKLVDVLNL